MSQTNNRITAGLWIREYRLGCGASLREWARKLDIAPSYLSDIECDKRALLRRMLDKICLRCIDPLSSREFHDRLMELAGLVCAERAALLQMRDEFDRYVFQGDIPLCKRNDPVCSLMVKLLHEIDLALYKQSGLDFESVVQRSGDST